MCFLSFREILLRLMCIVGFPIHVDSIISFLRSPAILLMLSHASQNKQRSKGNWTGIIIVPTSKRNGLERNQKQDLMTETEMIPSIYLD